MRKFLILFFVLIFLWLLFGCGASEKAEPASEQTKPSVGTYSDEQHTIEANVKESSIEVFIIGVDSKTLFWAGTWEDANTVVSKAYKDRNVHSMLGDESATKKFTVDGDSIKFTVQMMGMTRHVTVTR